MAPVVNSTVDEFGWPDDNVSHSHGDLLIAAGTPVHLQGVRPGDTTDPIVHAAGILDTVADEGRPDRPITTRWCATSGHQPILSIRRCVQNNLNSAESIPRMAS